MEVDPLKKKAFHNVYSRACSQNPEAQGQACPVHSLGCSLDGTVGGEENSWGRIAGKVAEEENCSAIYSNPLTPHIYPFFQVV